jgi:hypothetical protein
MPTLASSFGASNDLLDVEEIDVNETP